MIYKIGKKALSVKADPAIVEQLMAARGITGVPVDVACARFMRFKASDGQLDTGGDVIIQSGWMLDEWLGNPAMFADHKHTIECTIARGLTAFVQGDGLFVDCFFIPPDLAPNQLSESCFKLYTNGLLTDCSVGAVPESTRYASENDKATFGRSCWRVWETSNLKELSCVGIGMNARAKVEAVAKAFKDKILNADDEKALLDSDSEELIGLVERSVFRLREPVSVQVKKFEPVDPPAPPPAPDFGAIMKQMEGLTIRSEAAVQALSIQNREAVRVKAAAENGLVLPLTVQDAQALLAHMLKSSDEIEAAAQLLRTYIPDDSSSDGGDSASDHGEPAGGVPLSVADTDDGKSLSTEIKSVAGKLEQLVNQTSERK
jgi:hypothetical protein